MYVGNGQYKIILSSGKSVTLDINEMVELNQEFFSKCDKSIKDEFSFMSNDVAPQSYYMESQTKRVLQMGDSVEEEIGVSMSPKECSDVFYDYLYEVAEDTAQSCYKYYNDKYIMIPKN